MEGIKKSIQQIIKSTKGISLLGLKKATEEADPFLIEKSIEELIKAGLIVHIWDKYYPTGRQISVYGKEDDKLVEEFELSGLESEEISKVLIPHLNDPLFYECYELNSENAKYFIDKYKVNCDFEQYDYYLEAYFDNTTNKEKKNNS